MNTFFMILLALLFFGVYGAVNYYIGLRGWQHLGRYIPFMNMKVYWIVFWFIVLAYVIFRFVESYFPESVSNIINLIGSYWMVIMVYLLIILPLIDLILFINRRISFLPKSLTQITNISAIWGVVVIIFITTLLIYGTWSGRSPNITTYNLDIIKKAGNIKALKIAMVSDVHLGGIVDNHRLTKMVDKINEMNPDIVLLAGDIIDNKLEPFVKQNMGINFKRLKSKYGVYAAMGNHEAFNRNLEEVEKQYEQAGIKVLRDEAVLVAHSFYVIGREASSRDSTVKRERKELSQIIQGIDRGMPLIVMDHEPSNLQESEKQGVDLQVSGHTHKGQFTPINIITGLIYEVDYGYLKKGDTSIVVSSGFGTWGPPVRIGSRSEIVEINLKFKQ
jgi:uncharacterized protein